MSVPKKKRTYSSKKKRRSHHSLSKTGLFNCPQCKSPVKAHQACPTCGSYRGRQALNIKLKNKQKTK